MPTIDYILIAIAVILGVAVLVQVIVLTAAGLSALKTMKAAREIGDEMRPLMVEAKDLMQTAGQIIKRIEPNWIRPRRTWPALRGRRAKRPIEFRLRPRRSTSAFGDRPSAWTP